MTVYEKLLAVQSELKAPKGQYNAFGKYKYRSCEDILEAAKPILAKYKAVIYISDALFPVGDRYYIEATAHFIDVETGSEISTASFAREEESKKGMDGSQVTGASSSYARKYALNGLLCIDDTKDSDTTNTGNNNEKPQTAPKSQKETARKRLIAALKAKGIDINVFAQQHNLHPNTSDDVYEDLLIELENGNGV